MERTPSRNDGLKNFEEIWTWPADVNDALLGDAGLKERYIENLQVGVRFRLQYAGCLTETVGMHFVVQDLESRGVKNIDVQTTHSCDVADGPQKIFHAMPEELRPTHGFQDIEDLLPMDVWFLSSTTYNRTSVSGHLRRLTWTRT